MVHAIRSLAFVLVLAVSALGCTQATWIYSTPPGALVHINNKKVGVTPLVYKSKSGLPKRFRIRLEKEGFEVLDFYLDSTMSWEMGYIGAISLVPLFWAWSLQREIKVNLTPISVSLGLPTNSENHLSIGIEKSASIKAFEE